MKGYRMLVFEITQDENILIDEIKNSIPDITINPVDSISGDDIVQILVPLAAIIAPVTAQTIQKYFSDNRVTIKFDGVEVSALGYDKAMKILKEVLKAKDTENDDE
jgi:hypothetical protein